MMPWWQEGRTISVVNFFATSGYGEIRSSRFPAGDVWSLCEPYRILVASFLSRWPEAQTFDGVLHSYDFLNLKGGIKAYAFSRLNWLIQNTRIMRTRDRLPTPMNPLLLGSLIVQTVTTLSTSALVYFADDSTFYTPNFTLLHYLSYVALHCI